MPPSISSHHIGDHSFVLDILSKPANLALAAFVFGIILIAYRFLSDPLKGVPGPLLARFTKLWQLQALHKGQFEKVNIELHKKYGSSASFISLSLC